MTNNIAPVPTVNLESHTRVAVIGDIHAHPEQFFSLLKILPEDCLIVSLGDIFDKGFGDGASWEILHYLRELHREGRAFMVKGNHEEKRVNKLKKNGRSLGRWVLKQPQVLTFVWSNSFRLTCVHAGVCPTDTWESLVNDENVLYVRDVDSNGKRVKYSIHERENGRKDFIPNRAGQNWHDLYDGRFGYIASGHAAQVDGEAKFYPHSCNLDSAVFKTGILTAQIFHSEGRGELLTVKGPIKYGR